MGSIVIIFGLTYWLTQSFAWSALATLGAFALQIGIGLNTLSRLERRILACTREEFALLWTQLKVDAKRQVTRRLLCLSMSSSVTPAMAEDFAVMAIFVLPKVGEPPVDPSKLRDLFKGCIFSANLRAMFELHPIPR